MLVFGNNYRIGYTWKSFRGLVEVISGCLRRFSPLEIIRAHTSFASHNLKSDIRHIRIISKGQLLRSPGVIGNDGETIDTALLENITVCKSFIITNSYGSKQYSKPKSKP